MLQAIPHRGFLKATPDNLKSLTVEDHRPLDATFAEPAGRFASKASKGRLTLPPSRTHALQAAAAGSHTRTQRSMANRKLSRSYLRPNNQIAQPGFHNKPTRKQKRAPRKSTELSRFSNLQTQNAPCWSATSCSPTDFLRSTIGARGLNFWVRNGTRCTSPAMVADQQGAFCFQGGAADACPQGRTA